jgi:hypothetical protein
VFGFRFGSLKVGLVRGAARGGGRRRRRRRRRRRERYEKGGKSKRV